MTVGFGNVFSRVVPYFGIASALCLQGLRPLTWRRPVRAEFWRFMDIVALRNLLPVCVTASLVGFALVSQGLYWLDRLGDVEDVRSLLVSLLISQIAPIFVGFLTLGRGGLIMLGEIGMLREARRLDALERQGLDPFLLLLVPRTAAIIVAQFSHTVIFIVVAFVTGYLGALLAGVTSAPFGIFLLNLLQSLGETGFLAVPVKSFFLGLTISAVCGLSALSARDDRDFSTRAASGLIRALSALLIVSSLLTILI